MYYVYILYCLGQNKFYTGYTANLKRRYKQHVNRQVISTKRLGNPKLVYYEAFINKLDAQRREIYLKTTQGKRGIKLILREFIRSKITGPIV